MSSKSIVSTILYIVAVVEIVLGAISGILYGSSLGIAVFCIIIGATLSFGMMLIAFATLVENSARQAERLEEISRKLDKLEAKPAASTAARPSAKVAKPAALEGIPDGEETTTCKNCGIELRVGQICPICGKRSS